MTLKDKIIVEALKMFATKGFNATSTSDIIKAAGTSKGGLYNHFKSKEELFLEALSMARKIWRERNLHELNNDVPPIEKVKKILTNYRDRYIVNSENLPGGCIFINLTVELADQNPNLAEEVSEGFKRLKGMLRRYLNEERDAGTLKDNVDTDKVVELIFSGLLGACVLYTSDKSKPHLDMTIDSLLDYLDQIRK